MPALSVLHSTPRHTVPGWQLPPPVLDQRHLPFCPLPALWSQGVCHHTIATRHRFRLAPPAVPPIASPPVSGCSSLHHYYPAQFFSNPPPRPLRPLLYPATPRSASPVNKAYQPFPVFCSHENVSPPKELHVSPIYRGGCRDAFSCRKLLITVR